MSRSLRIALVCAVPLLGAWEWLTAPDPDVATGNLAYEAGEYNAALEAYKRAKKERGTAAALELDRGAALYKLAETTGDDTDMRNRMLEQAVSAFRAAAESSDPELKSAAYYNIGNAAFLRERWPEAIDAYRKALRANQDNDNARYNLELTLRKLERDKDPSRSAGQGQPGQGGNQGQTPRPDQQGQGQGQGQQDKQPDRRQGGDPGHDQNQQGQPDGQGSDDKRPDPPRDQGGSGQQGGGQSPPPGSGDGSGDRDRPPGSADPDGSSGAGIDDRSERDRKLDALENRSRDLRRRRLRRGSRSSGNRRFGVQKDW